jgi:hypothetical protein
LHPQALTELDVKLAPHPALIPNRLSSSCSLILRNLYQEKRVAEIESHASSDV